jgi:hypothetical protein
MDSKVGEEEVESDLGEAKLQGAAISASSCCASA